MSPDVSLKRTSFSGDCVICFLFLFSFKNFNEFNYLIGKKQGIHACIALTKINCETTYDNFYYDLL